MNTIVMCSKPMLKCVLSDNTRVGIIVLGKDKTADIGFMNTYQLNIMGYTYKELDAICIVNIDDPALDEFKDKIPLAKNYVNIFTNSVLADTVELNKVVLTIDNITYLIRSKDVK